MTLVAETDSIYVKISLKLIFLDCGAAPTVAGADASPSGITMFLAGESVTYSCTEFGYETSYPTVTCGADGTWSSFMDCFQTRTR